MNTPGGSKYCESLCFERFDSTNLRKALVVCAMVVGDLAKTNDIDRGLKRILTYVV